MPLERKKVGEVFHFYTKIGVAAIRVTDDGIAIGDTVQIQGPSTNLEQAVEALQIEHALVSRAGPGQEVGMKVRDRVREKDFVYKLIPMEGPAQAPPPKAAPKPPVKMAPAKKAPAKKPRAKKAPRKKAPVRRKASRAPRSKARRASRRSRSRSR
jgi:putative protease